MRTGQTEYEERRERFSSTVAADRLPTGHKFRGKHAKPKLLASLTPSALDDSFDPSLFAKLPRPPDAPLPFPVYPLPSIDTPSLYATERRRRTTDFDKRNESLFAIQIK